MVWIHSAAVCLKKITSEQRVEAANHASGQAGKETVAWPQRSGKTSTDQHQLMDLLRIVVGQVDAEGRATEKEHSYQSLYQILQMCFLKVFDCLPVSMPNENICLACIFLEDICDFLSQGIKSVCSSYLGCWTISMSQQVQGNSLISLLGKEI